MPTKSSSQHKLMQAVAHNPAFAKKVDIPQKVGKEFVKEDAKMAGGGLYANIAAKKQRIASGSGEKMRSVGSKGAPKSSDFANAAKTASYKEGGKSTVNAAGNYTKPELRKRIFNDVKSQATAGTGAGEWSARKAQVVAKRYKDAGGGYRD
tara:strand:- start:286 stop:738 length:453 start_codon:yes stop_codon:yes gene_type:complete